MNRVLTCIVGASARNGLSLLSRQPAALTNTHASRALSGHHEESPEEFDQRFIDYFNRPNIDGWEVRKAMTDLQGHDLIPEPKVVSAALRACRRINDLALAVRFLEAVHIKCGTKKHVDQVYPWILQEIRPVLDELGISTPEELGYDKPELFIPDAAWWWERSWYKDYGYDKLKGYKY